METIKAAIGLAPTTTIDADATEPVAGEKGEGTGLEPYDAGNNPEACEAAERVRAEEDGGEASDNVPSSASDQAGAVESNVSAKAETPVAASEGKDEKEDKTADDEKDEKAGDDNNADTSSPADGKPKENPSAIPTAGGEKVGTQPVPGRESGAATPALADSSIAGDGPKQGETGGPPAESESRLSDDAGAATNETSNAILKVGADSTGDKMGESDSLPNGSTTAASAPPASSAETPTKTATAEKPVSSAQKAINDTNGSPSGGSLERKPSRMSRLVNRLKGRKSRGGGSEETD